MTNLMIPLHAIIAVNGAGLVRGHRGWQNGVGLIPPAFYASKPPMRYDIFAAPERNFRRLDDQGMIVDAGTAMKGGEATDDGDDSDDSD